MNHVEVVVLVPRKIASWAAILCAGCALSLAYLPLAFAADEEPEPPSTILLQGLHGGSDVLTVRPSGEVQVRIPHTVLATATSRVRVSLSFRNLDEYSKVIESADLSSKGGALRLSDLDGMIFRGPAGLETVLKGEAESSLSRLISSAEGVLCSDVVARGWLEILPGVPMGLSIHQKSLAPRVPIQRFEKSLPPEDCELQCQEDVFEDCDFFAFGGCGGPSCVNACVFTDCSFSIGHSTCKPYSVPGPDICLC